MYWQLKMDHVQMILIFSLARMSAMLFQCVRAKYFCHELPWTPGIESSYVKDSLSCPNHALQWFILFIMRSKSLSIFNNMNRTSSVGYLRAHSFWLLIQIKAKMIDTNIVLAIATYCLSHSPWQIETPVWE